MPEFKPAVGTGQRDGLDPALAPFLRFPVVLRGAGFAVSPDQTMGFVAAVEALGPRGIEDVRQAGLALFAIQPERRGEYDALFRAVFLGQSLAAEADGEGDEVEAFEPTGAEAEAEVEDGDPAGQEATAAERLGARDLGALGDAEALTTLVRGAERLPRRRSYRRVRGKAGERLDLRRALREAAQRDGDVAQLHWTRRKLRARRIVVLVDVSGSMADRSEGLMRFAHALVQTGVPVEIFTLGTRLTRVTRALRVADRARALERVAATVADFDGGTRIGDALQALLAVPRYAGALRGSAVVVLSDGLERGSPAAMIDAVARVQRLAWRLTWLTPLAADPDYVPRTEALSAVVPWLDDLGDGARIPAIVDHVLRLGRAA